MSSQSPERGHTPKQSMAGIMPEEPQEPKKVERVFYPEYNNKGRVKNNKEGSFKVKDGTDPREAFDKLFK